MNTLDNSLLERFLTVREKTLKPVPNDRIGVTRSSAVVNSSSPDCYNDCAPPRDCCVSRCDCCIMCDIDRIVTP